MSGGQQADYGPGIDPAGLPLRQAPVVAPEPARWIPEELLRQAERLARVRLRLAQLARLIDLDETTAEWEQMVEGEIPPSVAFLLSADLDELGGHLEDVESFLRETAFIPTTGRDRTIPDIQAELRRLVPEVSSVNLDLQALWREIEQSLEESSPLRGLARSFASGYTEAFFSKADALDEAEDSLREDSSVTDEELARELARPPRLGLAQARGRVSDTH